MATAPSFSGGAWAAARSISGRRAHQALSRKFSVAFVGIKASPRMLFNAKDSNGRNDVQGKRKSLDLIFLFIPEGWRLHTEPQVRERELPI